MLLVFDVGNTETTIGVFDGETLVAHWRVMTATPRTGDELAVLLRGLLALDAPAHLDITGAAIGSVVPGATAPLADACARLTRGPVRIIDASVALPIRVDVDEPLTVGADRLVNTLAASRLFAHDAIVVDLGTATTFDCITRDGVFIGGVIAPGVQTALETLVRRTSKLPATDLAIPSRVIGRRTEECIRAGVVFGQAEAIDGIVRRIKAEWPGVETPMVIATGGLAERFQPLCREFDRVEPWLTLHGLRLAFDVVAGARSQTGTP